MVVRKLHQVNGIWHCAAKRFQTCQPKQSHHLQHLLHAVLLDGDFGFPTRAAGDGARVDSETTTQRIVCGQRVARGADAQDIRKHTHQIWDPVNASLRHDAPRRIADLSVSARMTDLRRCHFPEHVCNPILYPRKEKEGRRKRTEESEGWEEGTTCVNDVNMCH